MKPLKLFNTALKVCSLGAIVSLNLLANAAVDWPSQPSEAITAAPPMTMLVTGKDHKLFYEAYNDASDVDSDGTLDIRFKPEITYYGLYDSTLCYSYASGLFSPARAAGTGGVCTDTDTDWSGNWLNYMTTSRIDALRKVLYGGFRTMDTADSTILERAYIPQDAHSWGKEYTSEAADGFKISEYTPFAAPADGKRHFFGNLTPNRSTNCSTLDNCSNIKPVLRVRTNVANNRRIWEWASKERPVLENNLSDGPDEGTADDLISSDDKVDYQVRVEVCTAAFHNPAECKAYGTKYKPVGLLHQYGENDSMLFGLMTGSYDKHMSGGRLRKVVSSFANEVDPKTGVFNTTKPIVDTFNKLRIRGFNQSSTSGEYWKSNPYEDSAKAPTEGQLVDWGNPIGEMLYEATRYFAGKKAATPAFAGVTTVDEKVGLTSVAWDDPYATDSEAKSAFCSKANFLTISDVNASFDSDAMPGAADASFGGITGDLTGLNVVTLGGTITAIQSNITGKSFFIGQNDLLATGAPTAKVVSSLGTIRGLPEEPTKQGSYFSASTAFYAKTTDLRNDLEDKQTIDSYVVALSSPLPKIEAKLPNGEVITLVPFSKTVGGSGVSNLSTAYQPTNQIVDFYVETIANSGAKDIDATVNGGRYSATFQINFEDVEQGGDHDMDAIARYVVQANANNTLSVTVTPTYQAGGMKQNMGYVISGSTKDGVYLVASDESTSPGYYLNVPAGRAPGYCTDITRATCNNLPSIGSTAIVPYVFSPSNDAAAGQLKPPLWFAAKFGGFLDSNDSNTPDLTSEWDKDNDGVPDTYFQVQNPLKLVESLRKAFDTIVERSGGGGNISANSTGLTTDTLVFQAIFNSTNWSGDLEAYPITKDGVGAIASWKASQKIPADYTKRNIFYGSDGAALGKKFEWGNLSTIEKALLNDDEKVLNFLRGNRDDEIRKGGAFRNRSEFNVLGDIAHSSPRYSKDSGTVFVGANDGMLHAFDATTGAEQFAYMPRTMLSKANALTKTDYKTSHLYFVDGETAISTAADTGGKNYLVTTLGRGGKGLFGLDVTDPENFEATDVLWDKYPKWIDSDADGTLDKEVDPDMGYMLGRPVIAQLKSGTWAVIVGNGYNSTSGKAVLHVYDLATGTLIRKLDTGVGSDNGLATPGVLLDTTGKATAVYAGDLKGNVWEFDISHADKDNWIVANAGAPFFTAQNAAGKAQPITAPITMKVNNSGDDNDGKLFVYFGTGSDFATGDSGNSDVQTWYGLIDDGEVIHPRSDTSNFKLTERTITATGTLDGIDVRVFSEAAEGDMKDKEGFFMDLPDSGERIVTASNYYVLAEPVLIASSVVPVVDVCVPGGYGYLNAINPFTGGRLSQPFFDVNDNNDFSDDVLTGDGGGNVGSVRLDVGKPGEAIVVGDRLVVGGSKPAIDDIRINLGIAPRTGRLSWREIVVD